MPFPVAGSPENHPQYSGLLIPEIWSPRILERFYEFSVLEHIANTDYEGEIRKFGDKVVIRTRPSITIRDYEKGQRLQFERPLPTTVELEIDQGKYWDFLVEDVDQAQADYDYMADWTAGAGEEMNEVINEDVLQTIPASVDANNQGATAGVKSAFFNLGEVGTPIEITKDNVISKLGHASAVLTEQRVPQRDRWMVVPAWFESLVFDSDVRNALITGNDQDMLRKGHIGNLAGFDLFLSNQLLMAEDSTANELVTSIVFGHRSALTFASQLVHSRVKEPDDYFGVLAQGLNVYGYNVNKPDAMGLLYAHPGTPA